MTDNSPTEQLTEAVNFDVDGHSAIITINRPNARNAVNGDVASGIEAGIDRLEGDDNLWVGIITGVPPVFSAGADLKEINAGNAAQLATERGGFAGITKRVRSKPIIAAVDGPALAGGTEIVLSCDLVVASTSARFGIPEVKRSLIAGAGGLFRLPRRIPFNIAMEAALTGDPFDAETAARFGLVNELVEPGEVLAKALALAERIIANAPVAVRETRKVVVEAAGADEEMGWKLTDKAFGAAVSSEDFSEGLTASSRSGHRRGRVAEPVAELTTVEVIEQLRQTWSSVTEVCSSLTSEEWRSPTACPGWDVRAQVAHLVGTESMLAGRPTPAFDGPYGDHVHNEIAKFNEAWIASFAGVSDADLLAAFAAISAERIAALSSLGPEDWEASGPTPIGEAPYRRFMEIRVFDSWAHEQDIRFATDRPGHQSGPAVERCVDEAIRALGFVVGKRARAPEGSLVRFSLVGFPSDGSPAAPTAVPAPPRDVDVVVTDRARVVPSGSAPPTVTVHSDPVTFVRLGCGRMAGPACLAGGTVTLSGDTDLGERVIANLAFTM